MKEKEYKGVNNMTETSKIETTAAASGYRSVAAALGPCSTAAASGRCSTAAASGNRSESEVSGDYSACVCVGCDSHVSAKGQDAICIGWGRNNKAKAAKGCYIVLSEWGTWDDYRLVDAKIYYVDGETVKADVWYQLINGELVEVSEE